MGPAPEAAAGAGLPPARNLAAIQGSPARSGQQKAVVVGEGGVVVVGNGTLQAVRCLDDAHLHSRGDAARLKAPGGAISRARASRDSGERPGATLVCSVRMRLATNSLETHRHLARADCCKRALSAWNIKDF